MTDHDEIQQSILGEIRSSASFADDNVAKLLKNLALLNQTRPTPEPAPAPVPEPEKEKSFWDKHGDELIKGGAGVVSVFAILIFEKGLHGIITSKATSFVPRS